jgi:serine/threonine-protein kinase
MAEVFEGRDRLLARRVAIKVLLAQYARDPAFLVRFKREAQAAASLSHPNIVAVYDTGAEAATQFIVMEYVEGRTLRQVLRAEGRLLPERAAEIAVAVCGALSAAHARGLVHRDIKPGNVMLTPSGGVKVMDFGIARAVAAESVTQTSAVVGTAQYLSPEQAQGLGVDGRSDVYGLGCCVYEMVTGVVPFSGSSPVAIAYRHVREAPRPPRVVNPEVPVGVEAVVLRAMAKRPEDRYQTAAEFREDLERFLAGHHVLATPPLSEQTTQAISRAPTDGAAQTAMLGNPIPPSPVEQYTDAYDDLGKRPRSSIGWLVLVALAVALAALIGYLLMSRLADGGGTITTTSLEPPVTTAAPATQPTAPPTTAATKMVPRASTNQGSTALGLVGGGSTAIPIPTSNTQAMAPMAAQRPVIGSSRRDHSDERGMVTAGPWPAAVDGSSASAPQVSSSATTSWMCGPRSTLVSCSRRSLVVAMAAPFLAAHAVPRGVPLTAKERATGLLTVHLTRQP